MLDACREIVIKIVFVYRFPAVFASIWNS